MTKTNIFVWEMTGALFISALGSLLHFVFGFAGEWPPVALIAAVNESVWEHLKLAFWPAIIYALIQWPFFRRHVRAFWTAKAVGIFTMPVIIAFLFFGYTAFTGHNILWLDISLFVFAVFAGQMVSSLLMLRRSFSPELEILAKILLVIMITTFSLFTFFPPHYPLFCDPPTGHYGILK
jgi:hypothetical protein